MRRKEEEGGRRLSFAQHRPVSEHFASWAPPPNHLLSHCKQRKRKPALASFRGFWSDTHTCLESSYASNIKLLETYKLTIELTIEPSSSHGNTLYKRLRTLCNHSECVNISDKSNEKCLWARTTEPLKWCTLPLTYCSLVSGPCKESLYNMVMSVMSTHWTDQHWPPLSAWPSIWLDTMETGCSERGLYWSTPHHGYMERMSRTTICWGWKNALATRRTSFRNWGGTSAVGEVLYITVLVSVLVKVVLVSYSIAYDVSNSWCSEQVYNLQQVIRSMLELVLLGLGLRGNLFIGILSSLHL